MARPASDALTRQCAQEIIWSMDDSGNPHPDVWEHIDDYCGCGSIYHAGSDYALDPDRLYDAIQDIRSKK